MRLIRPDDWHVHLRSGELLSAVLPATARVFGRALVMPNLRPPLTTPEAVGAYLAQLRRPGFTPLGACYLTDDTRPEDVARGAAAGVFTAVKLYPAHATTNAAAGVTSIERVRAVLERMAELGLPLCVHAETTDGDVFDREALFLDRVLGPLLDRTPGLRVVVEHVSSAAGVDFVRGRPGVAATITLHHLVLERSAMFAGGLRPHAYCLPVAKTAADRAALRAAATSGDPRFFLGTDSAPHLVEHKERDGGAAGLFTAPVALEGYAEVFEEEGALDRLEGFASLYGPAFYGLPPNPDAITLERADWTVPLDLPVAGSRIRVFRGGETLRWRLG